MSVTLVHEGPDRVGPPALAQPLRLQVLGPLRLWRGTTELDAGPRQQSYLLALLLARGGRPTGAAELIDLIWGEGAPASALNVIHKHIGSLRRLLEPDLPSRDAGTYLVRRGAGYLCAAGADVLDLAAFRHLTGAARSALAAADGTTALDLFVEALGLWSGPAGDGWAHGPAAASIFAGLDDVFFRACVDATGVALSHGCPERVLPALHLAATMAPLHEPVQSCLMDLLGATGLQAEALAVFDTVRSRLVNDLGIDPGASLAAAHHRVLAQTRSSTSVTQPAPPSGTAAGDTGVPGRLVGRSDEIATLRHALEPTFAARTAVVLLEGEPGAGKSRLLEELACHAAARGALVVRGHCLEGEGTPTMWPWIEVVTGLVDAMAPDRRERWLSRDLGHLVGTDAASWPTLPIPDSSARFRLQEQLVDVIAESARERPVVMVIDDLQWADPSSLQVLEHVIARLPAGSAAVGASRDSCPSPSPDLSHMLAAASRAPGHRRVRVGPLSPPEVAELVQLETGVVPTTEIATLVHSRTGGNPFFVQELGRLWTAGEAASRPAVLSTGVPLTVRDVVRDRLGALDHDAQKLLEVAALVGRDVEIAVLARAASLDVSASLGRLEPVRALGLIGPSPGDPYSYRFVHDLVRQAVSEAIPPGRAAALHGRIADALEGAGLGGESVAERVAHHLWAAGPLGDAARTVDALIRAGARAKEKTALGAAERQLRSAVELARRSSLLELELEALSQLIAVVGMRSMYGRTSVSLLERAEQVARGLGRERDAAGFLFSRWTAHGQGLELETSGPLARRLLTQGTASDDLVVRLYGQAAWGIHQWHLGNVGESFRTLSALHSDGRSEERAADPDPVRDGLQLLTAGTFAEISAYHGDAAQARVLHDRLETAAGDDPYAVTVATTMAARTAAVVGDPEWALGRSARGIAVDPHFSFVFLGTYLRLARCWAMAMSGRDPGPASDEAERLILVNLSNPVRSCVSTWYALLAEMRIAAGSLSAASAALDRADDCLERYGQRSAEGLVVLVRAQLAAAAGDHLGAVRLAERARAVAIGRGAHLFASRAELLLTALQVSPVPRAVSAVHR